MHEQGLQEAAEYTLLEGICAENQCGVGQDND